MLLPVHGIRLEMTGKALPVAAMLAPTRIDRSIAGKIRYLDGNVLKQVSQLMCRLRPTLKVVVRRWNVLQSSNGWPYTI